MPSETITICACKSRSFIEKDKLATITATLKSNGYQIELVDDICRMVVDQPENIKTAAKGTIMACYNRAIKSHLDWLDVEPNNIVDIRNRSTQDVLNDFQISSSACSSSTEYKEVILEIEALPVYEGTDAWYPVIDESRCTNCGKCHDFCLFGVYSLKDKQVQVTQPHNCKNNCPACARICPSKAIIFPKYEKSPINGGTELEEVFSEEDMEAMYQKRLQYRLQQNRNRFSLFKEDK